jgi:hypothetical protein
MLVIFVPILCVSLAYSASATSSPSPTPNIQTEDCRADIILVCDALIESLRNITILENGEAWSNITETTAKKLESKGLLEMTNKYIGKFLDAKAEIAIANRKWTTDAMNTYCKGRSKAEIRARFGKPEAVMLNSWTYPNLKIEDSDAGVYLTGVQFCFDGQGRVRDISFGGTADRP